MSRAVIILGAGSSADFGVPTLANLFKDAHARLYLKQNPKLSALIQTLFWEPRGHTLETSDLSISIEQMLTLVKDLEKVSKLPVNVTIQDIVLLRRKLHVLIQRAVFEGKTSRPAHLNPLIYMAKKTFDHTLWASFNWDCIFESSYWYSQTWWGPGTRSNPSLVIPMDNWRQGSSQNTLVKLHGGINWWLVGNKVTYLEWTGNGNLAAKWDAYDKGTATEDRPVILEPSFYKYEDTSYRQLAPQWDRFREELAVADCILIVGYSLPEMDINARSSILTSFQANQNGKWLIIDPSPRVCELYGRLLGRRKAEIIETSLAGFNNDMQSRLQAAFLSVQIKLS